MVVRNVVRSPVRAVVQSVFGEGESFHPFQLFTSGAQGAWYDPSDFSTLYQDAAGTTPVTAVEQPVRLMLDRSRGLVLGSELVANGGFDSDSGWTLSAGWAVSGGQATFTANGTNAAITRVANAAAVSGRMYEITFDIVANTLNAGAFRVGAFSGSSYFNALVQLAANTTPPGTYTLRAVSIPSGTGTVLDFWVSNAATSGALTIDNVSVRELPGNHALAPNDASRPVLRSRYNLLTRSEEFDDAAWTKVDTTVTANAIAAPNGTLTADLCTEGTAGSGAVLTASAVSVTVASPITATIFAKRGNSDWLHIQLAGTGTERIRGWFNLATGTVGSTTVTGSATGAALAIEAFEDGWYRCRLTGTLNGAGSTCAMLTTIMSADTSLTRVNNSTRYIWGASLLTAADHAATGGAYQRVGSATDYDTGPPWRPYLAFDGSDDSMSTSSIDFSGTDEMTVFAGVTKLSDAALGMLVELSVNAATENGSFFLAAPRTTTTADFGFRSTGTTLRDATSAASYSAPTTRVLTGIGDISGDVATLRIDGAEVATNTDDQGTGNYGNHALFIGRRNNTSFPFNGRLYSLAVLGRTATAPELTAMESWIAGKTGVSL